MSDISHTSLAAKARRSPVYEALDGILVRAPILPIEAYLEPQLPSVEAPLRRALAVGSLDLLDELERPVVTQNDLVRRERALLRYHIRMATRPTPYGLFAGVALAHWGEQTKIAFAAADPNLSIRPDMEWLMQLIWRLEASPLIWPYLRFQTNPAAYVRKGRVFLLEELPTGKPKKEQNVSVKATGATMHTLSLARQSIGYNDLVECLLTSTPGATLLKVEALLTTLWRHTFLQTDLRPSLVDSSPVTHLHQRLKAIPLLSSLSMKLQDYLAVLELWERLPVEESIREYRVLLEKAQEIDCWLDDLLHAESNKVPATSKGKKTPQYLQVDMEQPLASSQLSKMLGEEIAATAELLLRLSPFRDRSLLASYRLSFLERYGDFREVPLLELLDPQVGMGLPAFYTDEQAFHHEQSQQLQQREQHLLTLALTALREHQTVLQLDETTLEPLTGPLSAEIPMPPSLDIYVIVAASSADAVNEGNYHLIIGPTVGTNQARRALGRFTNLLGEETVSLLQQTAQREAAHTAHALWADLIYLPKEDRLANVVLSPAPHAYTIPYGVSVDASNQHVIPLDELVVGVRNHRFYIRWVKKQEDIQLSIGHMLNELHAPAIARFLVDISRNQGPLLNNFRWGPAESFPFLPRVQVGRCVLRLAQWQITTSFHLDELKSETIEQFHHSLKRWCQNWGVPRYVYLGEMDQRLLLDLERREHREVLYLALQKIKREERVLLQEGLPGPEHAWIEGPGGKHYLSEFVVSLMQRQARSTQAAGRAAAYVPYPVESRVRPLGSEWLFIKLYCAPQLQEALITQHVYPFAQKILTQQAAQDWFFLRYADPDPHIRLRFRGDPKQLLHSLLPQLTEWATHLMVNGPCRHFTFDVYEREIERYGGLSGINIAETLFGIDSRMVVELLQHRGQVQMDHVDLAVLSIDILLAQLGLTPSMRLQWYREQVKAQSASGALYRQKKHRLRALLSSAENNFQTVGDEAMANSYLASQTPLLHVADRLEEALSRGELTQPVSHLYSSYVHLHCNRLLGINAKAERMALELLLRIREGLDKTPLPGA
ncbi:lantibiotic dehydratase [Ktedonospora formicarum]|uniref:lantibiotic dehydratase n=1 Tax=Ktedonospora formicarum TaxID=2778364 RepID=UPI001C693896|nr:lantibiotic dehydratase [Ktedonospora formicarum]